LDFEKGLGFLWNLITLLVLTSFCIRLLSGLASDCAYGFHKGWIAEDGASFLVLFLALNRFSVESPEACLSHLQ
jgi:hypothetical protein